MLNKSRLAGGVLAEVFLAIFLVLTSHGAFAESCEKAIQVETCAEYLDLSVSPVLRKNLFCVNRDVKEYDLVFGSRFMTARSRLSDGDVIVDFGSGQNVAILSMLSSFKSNRMPMGIGVVFQRPSLIDELTRNREELFTKAGLFKLFEGRLLEEIDANEFPLFDLATDFFGPISYTRNLSYVINFYLQHLRTANESEIFITGGEPNERSISENVTFILNKKGEIKSISSWLADQADIAVTQKQSVNPNSFSIRKLSTRARVPELELVQSIKNSEPPDSRLFREIGASLELSDSIYVSPLGYRYQIGRPNLENLLAIDFSKKTATHANIYKGAR